MKLSLFSILHFMQISQIAQNSVWSIIKQSTSVLYLFRVKLPIFGFLCMKASHPVSSLSVEVIAQVPFVT